MFDNRTHPAGNHPLAMAGLAIAMLAGAFGHSPEVTQHVPHLEWTDWLKAYSAVLCAVLVTIDAYRHLTRYLARRRGEGYRPSRWKAAARWALKWLERKLQEPPVLPAMGSGGEQHR